MTSVTKDYWAAYSALESQLRNVARMATIARFYAHEIEGLSADQGDEEICRLLFLVGHVAAMAEALVKTYDEAFVDTEQSGAGLAAV
jgi:hypothetical protein